MDLEEHWDEVAGAPWVGISRPVVLRDGELVVEADVGPAAGLLRYAVGDLHRRLDSRLGPGMVDRIAVRQPGVSHDATTAHPSSRNANWRPETARLTRV